jgi:hypothetical protein
MDALGRVECRYAGTEGEREMLHAVKERLAEGTHARIEGFVAYTSPGLVVGVHAAALLGAGVLGFFHPLVALVLVASVTLSLFAEGSGRLSLLRWVLPKSASYNLVVHNRPADPRGTLVLAAPLDAPGWHPNRPRWIRRPMVWVLGAAVVVNGILALRVLAEPWGNATSGIYVASLLVLAATVALGWMVHRRPGTLTEDASGPAAALELMRRFDASPPEGLEVWTVFTGCTHAYQNGMHAFFAMRDDRMTDPVLVLSLDDPGKAPFGAVVSEGPVRPEHHRPTGPALIERLRWAGLQIPAIDQPEPTNARAALQWGIRALAISGSDGVGDPRTAARAIDIAEIAVRMFASDVAQVAGRSEMIAGILARDAEQAASEAAQTGSPEERPDDPEERPDDAPVDSPTEEADLTEEAELTEEPILAGVPG